jgi:hypothetical protein
VSSLVPGAPTARDVQVTAARAAASPVARGLARFGYASKALVHLVVALLAIAVATGGRVGLIGRSADAHGAIAQLAQAPWGRALVALLAVGLALHALWFLIEGLADPGRHRHDAKGLAERAGKLFLTLVYASLALFSARIALDGSARGGGDAEARSWTARALELPLGTLLVLAGGAIAIGAGVHQIRKGLRCRRGDVKLRTERMGATVRRWAPRLGFAGLAAKGTLLALVGAFFVQAALEGDPREATGFDGALAWLAHQPYGTVLLALAALGLLAHAGWTALEARYRPLPG